MGSGLAVEMAKKLMATIQQALYLAAADEKALQTLGSRVISSTKGCARVRTDGRKETMQHARQPGADHLHWLRHLSSRQLVARREEKGVDLPSRILQPCKEISRKRKEGGVSPVDERCAMRAPKHVYVYSDLG